MKQLGRFPISDGAVLNLRDKHGGDWDEWREHGLDDLGVREFPKEFYEIGNPEDQDIRTAESLRRVGAAHGEVNEVVRRR